MFQYYVPGSKTSLKARGSEVSPGSPTHSTGPVWGPTSFFYNFSTPENFYDNDIYIIDNELVMFPSKKIKNLKINLV